MWLDYVGLLQYVMNTAHNASLFTKFVSSNTVIFPTGADLTRANLLNAAKGGMDICQFSRDVLKGENDGLLAYGDGFSSAWERHASAISAGWEKYRHNIAKAEDNLSNNLMAASGETPHISVSMTDGTVKTIARSVFIALARAQYSTVMTLVCQKYDECVSAADLQLQVDIAGLLADTLALK